MGKKKSLRDEYRFPGYSPLGRIKGIFGEPGARVITLKRIKKKRSAVIAEQFVGLITIHRNDGFEIYPAVARGYIWNWKYGELSARGAKG